MSDIPTTPAEVRELLEWTREKRANATPADIKFQTGMWAPNYMILGYLVEECGIDAAIVRAELVAMGADEAVAQIDSWEDPGTAIRKALESP